MRRMIAMTLLALGFVLGAKAMAGNSADMDYRFARHLLKEGKQAFALLEFERVRFHHKGHPRAADASYEAAWMYLTYADDLGKGVDLLEATSKDYPGTDAATRSSELLAFIQAHGSDQDGKPLESFLDAKAAELNGRHDAAATHFRNVYEKYPRASLAEDAMFAEGRLLITELDKTRDGLRTFQKLLDRYPRTRHAEKVTYYTAVGIEKLEGPGEKALTAYRRVVRDFPDSDSAREARARIADIEKSQDVVKRQHDANDVAEYKVVKKGYSGDDTDTYVVNIEMDIGLSERRVFATLEDALLKHYRDRKSRDHKVEVKGYYNYPVTPAGSLEWRSSGTSTYSLAKREAKDVVKDIFLELLKDRKD